MTRRSIARALTLAATAACALLALAGSASAASTINVNTTNDEVNNDTDCSLREATIAANDNAPSSGCTPGTGPGDTINVPNGRYTLSLTEGETDQEFGDLDIFEQVTIQGASTRGVIIDADGIDRVIELHSNELGQNGEARVGPLGQLPGGQNGPTTITNVTLTGGDSGNDAGGGLRSDDDLNLRQVTVDGNTSDGDGGGAQLGSGTVQIVRSTFSDNVDTSEHGGGAIHNNTQRLLIDSSTFSGNRTNGAGGAILEHGTRLELTSSTIVGNVAAAGQGGGGIADAEDGGDVSPAGGEGPSDIDTVRNTIIANNRVTGVQPSGGAPIDGDNCDAPLFTQGFNLENKDECGFSAGNDLPNTDPNTLALANNGGPTNTHALRRTSEAVDSGNSAADIDQRRMRRPQDGDGNGSRVDDRGAYEASDVGVTARSNSYTTNEDQPLNVPPPGVLGNDSDPQGDPLRAELVSGPAHGDVTLRPDGSFSYRPDPNYNGPDSFVYRACDNQEPRSCDEATVSIGVRPVDDGGTGGEGEEPCTINGTPGNDILGGTNGDDVICGGGGNDIIRAGDGEDIVRGGDGNDSLYGDDDDDEISGGRGDDDLHGGGGNDSLDGEAGNDDLFGQGGNDSLDASDGVSANDLADGGSGSDTCSSDPGDIRRSC